MGFSPFGNIWFSVIPAFVIGFFIVIFLIIIVRSIRGAKQWKQNNESPVLTVNATVKTKRANTRHHHNNTSVNDMHHTSSTTYFATFEVDSGDRMEFNIRDTEYGMLAENDKGKLTFQGTRYLGFERNRN